MGASQSSSSGGGGAAPSQQKTSYYELLGVSRQATEDEIKKAYRKKALELHPDRNYGNEEGATKTFAEVGAAYEVLSDPQERAWYDSHETAILRGDDVGDEEGTPTYENVRVTSADDLARLVRKFNSNVEFSDAPSGFFGYLRETFEQLAKEEDIAADWDNVEAPEYPSFGHKDDGYDDVVKRFYAGWSSFSTVKNFSWKDKYRLSEAPDRWYRRRMEQENKKFRQDGIREFNDAVRSLVAFVRKRDPRYVPSTQTEADRQKILRDAAAAQAARARAANEAKLDAEVPEWTKSRDPAEDELEGTFDEEEVEEQVLECVACNKIFKSEKQWEAHEKSKKHQKAVYALQKKMRKENANLDLNGSGVTSGVATPNEEVDDEEEEEEVLDDVTAEIEDDEARKDILDASEEVQEVGVKGQAGSKAELDDVQENAHEGMNGKSDVEESAHHMSTHSAEPSDSDDDDEYASLETVQGRLQSASLTDDTATPASTLSDDETDEGQSAKPKMGKAAQKRAKRAAAAAVEDAADANHKCVGCEAAFPTKTRLFQHLKDHPKHAAMKPAAGGGKAKKGKGKR